MLKCHILTVRPTLTLTLLPIVTSCHLPPLSPSPAKLSLPYSALLFHFAILPYYNYIIFLFIISPAFICLPQATWGQRSLVCSLIHLRYLEDHLAVFTEWNTIEYTLYSIHDASLLNSSQVTFCLVCDLTLLWTLTFIHSQLNPMIPFFVCVLGLPMGLGGQSLGRKTYGCEFVAGGHGILPGYLWG